MPKATVYKNDNFFLGKYNVRFPFDIFDIFLPSPYT